MIELEVDHMINQKFVNLDSIKETIFEKPGIGIDIKDFDKVNISNSYGFEYKW